MPQRLTTLNWILKTLGVLGLLSFLSPNSFGFPETGRRGYLSCGTCHYSPNGGGLLTAYGKTIAGELYSHWKPQNNNLEREDELPWWQVGGQLRLMQSVQDSRLRQRARFFVMQAELEAAIRDESWAIVTSLGAWRPVDAPSSQLGLYSRNHYGLWHINENWLLRGGHFRISHGLGLPDHKALIYESLGWTHSHETYNLELSYLKDEWVLQGTLVAPSRILVSNEKFQGSSLTIETMWKSEYKLGANLSEFSRETQREDHFNVYTVLPLTENDFLQVEVGHRSIPNLRSLDRGFFARYTRPTKWGLRHFIQWELAEHRAGLVENQKRFFYGLEWFPTQGVDLFTQLGQETEPNGDGQWVWNLMTHFYF